jgi:hypothetical protein
MGCAGIKIAELSMSHTGKRSPSCYLLGDKTIKRMDICRALLRRPCSGYRFLSRAWAGAGGASSQSRDVGWNQVIGLERRPSRHGKIADSRTAWPDRVVGKFHHAAAVSAEPKTHRSIRLSNTAQSCSPSKTSSMSLHACFPWR